MTFLPRELRQAIALQRAQAAARQPGRAKARAPRKPRKPRPAAKPPGAPKPLPAANCQFTFYPVVSGLLNHAPSIHGPALITSAFAAGQEAAEGDTRFQWTHVLLTRYFRIVPLLGTAFQDPWPAPHAAARPGVADDGTLEFTSTKFYLYPLQAKLFKTIPPLHLYQQFQFPLGSDPANPLPNGLPYYPLFIEHADRGTPRAHLRVYLRRGAGREL